MKGCQWKLQYDNDLNQYYYLNTKDNSISFDLPNEVVKTEKKLLLKKLSFKRKKSNSSICKSISNDYKNSLSKVSSPLSSTSEKSSNNSVQSSDSSINSFDDEYLLTNTNNFKNFAGTSLSYNYDDNASINSEQSIVTFYSDMDPTEFSNDYYSFDKEKERIELRLQFLKELQV